MSTPNRERQRLLLVYGGRSSEHEVSIRSAKEVLEAIDPTHFSVETLAIARDGRFRLGAAELELEVAAQRGELVENLEARLRDCDLVFPLLHGPWGEDGTFQGLLEVLQVPYVGSGVLASALCMDKAAFKTFVGAPAFEVPVTPGLDFDFSGRIDPERAAEQVLEGLGLPCFVKPANQGSSVGVSRVDEDDALLAALEIAAQYDPRVVVERAVNAREIELAVLGNGGRETIVSQPGEIGLPAGTWYDYDAKYVNDVATLSIPAELDPELITQLQDISLRAFRAAGCKGLARIDFLVDRETKAVYLNEVNTMPGFTSISMYPKLMAHAGIPYAELITRLCELALEHHARRADLAVER